MSQESCVCGFCDGTKCGNNPKPKATERENIPDYMEEYYYNRWQTNGEPQRYAKRCTCVEGYFISCPKHGYGNR